MSTSTYVGNIKKVHEIWCDIWGTIPHHPGTVDKVLAQDAAHAGLNSFHPGVLCQHLLHLAVLHVACSWNVTLFTFASFQNITFSISHFHKWFTSGLGQFCQGIADLLGVGHCVFRDPDPALQVFRSEIRVHLLQLIPSQNLNSSHFTLLRTYITALQNYHN